MIKNDIFYNYVYLDTRKPGDYNYGDIHFDFEPFYIGKGKDDRCYSHLYEKEETTYNPHKVRIINKIKKQGLKPIILKIYENLEENTALENEKMLVKLIGKTNNKTGPLTNITDAGIGGDTLSNHPNKIEIYSRISKANKGQKRTDEYRDSQKERIKNMPEKDKLSWYNNLSKSLKGLKKSIEHVKKMKEYKGEKHHAYGKPRSEETCQKIRIKSLNQFKDGMPLETRLKLSEYRGEKNSQYGKPKSDETKQKMSDSSICMKYVFKTPDDSTLELISYKEVVNFFGNDSILYGKKKSKGYKFIEKIKIK